jgi:two-component system, LytTR family, sensor kinase
VTTPRKFWLVALLAALVLGVAEASQLHLGAAASGRPLAWSRAFSATMPSWLVTVAFLPLIFWAARRFPIERGRRLRALAGHVPVAVVYAVGHLAIASWLSDYVLYRDHPLGYLPNLIRLLTVYFVMQLFFYGAIVAAHYAYQYYRKYRAQERAAAELELHASRLEASLAQANLEALRMQLNPHFLFNTLNTISVLALKGEGQAVARVLSRLSELLRIVLENSDQVVPLRDELELLDRYLEIEQVRFRDRLTVKLDIAPDVLDAEVPSLVLQPLVENALWHGIAQRPGAGRVEIGAQRVGDRLEIRVRDTGPGFGPSQRPARRKGVGLSNTRARLEQIYGDQHELDLGNAADGGAVVRLTIPFRQHEPAEDAVSTGGAVARVS